MINPKMMQAIADGLKPVIGEAFKAAVGPLMVRLAQLEARQPEKGEKGDAGRDGVDGQPGKDGQDGAAGRDGVDGAAGLDGKDGAPGRDGVDGQPGKDGVDGKDSDPEFVKARVAEAVSSAMVEVLKGLPVEFMVNDAGELCATYQGGQMKSFGRVRGEPGKDGASVMDAEVNADGQLILRMNDGRAPAAIGSVRGPAGRDGKDGQDGARGRDAHELRILHSIDESRSYAEGVVARFRGGLIRAERQTDPVEDGDILKAGWGVILEGLADEVERDLEDGRVIERVVTLTSGRKITHRRETATLIYRGIWTEGAFKRGDVVTRGGSAFVAIKDTSTTPETPDCDWKLAVKRGQNGKDGKPGERGLQGLPGPKGDRGFNGHA